VLLGTVIMYQGIYFVFLMYFSEKYCNILSRYIVLHFSWYLKPACVSCHVLHSWISPMKEQ
jgi:hypothetical protein